MNQRTMRTTAIATIVAFLLALGLGEVLAYYIVTPSRHIPGWLAAVIVGVAIVWGVQRYRRGADRKDSEAS